MRMPKLDRLFYKCMISLRGVLKQFQRFTEKQWNLHASKCFVVLCMQMMLTQTCSCLSDLYLLWFVVGKIESRSLACRCRRCTKLFVATQFFYFGRLLKINLFSVTTVILFLFWAFTENKFIFNNTYYFVSESAYAET